MVLKPDTVVMRNGQGLHDAYDIGLGINTPRNVNIVSSVMQGKNGEKGGDIDNDHNEPMMNWRD